MCAGSVRTITLAGSIGVLLLGAFAAALHRAWPSRPIARGVTVDERRLPEGREPALAWLAARRDAARARAIHFRAERRMFDATFETAGVELDADAMYEAAKRVAHEGPVLRRLREADRARRGGLDVAPVWRVDRERARALLASLAPELYKAPVDARVDLTKHERVVEEPGRELDVEASLTRLRDGKHEDDEVIDLVTRSVAPKVSIDQLTNVNIEKVVSAFETTFSLFGTGAGRAINIRKAVSFLNGVMLSPGQALSFNDTVGPRTRDRGFVLAPEIQGDEMQLGYGGGTCQASTTLYGAAVFGALDILERQAHSRPARYTQMGLDATVSYPLADLKIRNALPFPVLIHAFFPSPTTVRVEILGGDPVARVEYLFGVSSTEDFMRRVQIKNNLAPGERVLHQKGVMGYDVTSVVRLHYNDGRQDERHYFSGYRPAPEIYWVAPGFDLASLPPLPEHAKGVEGLGG
jgi:vancomycin resistance protein YoaR